MRPTWDELHMRLAMDMARRSTCNRAQVGCIIVRDNRIVSSGYNGSVSGGLHCCDSECRLLDGRCITTIHAEQNSIIDAAVRGISVAGGTAYVTHSPCWACLKTLFQAKVKIIRYNVPYRLEEVLALAQENGFRDQIDIGVVQV